MALKRLAFLLRIVKLSAFTNVILKECLNKVRRSK